MAGRDRPNDIPSYNGTGWFRQAALAVNWLLQRDVSAVVTSGSFALDDGTASGGGSFTFDDGGA